MITVERLTKYYRDKPAVLDVDFEVAEGEVVGLLGLNGAGKTTILRILCGDLAPSAGQVRIDGEPMDVSRPEARRRVGFLPETPPIYPEMTCRGFLGHLAGLRGVPRAEVARRVDEVLQRFGLLEVADAAAGTLSYGYKKRLGLAQASVHRPRLLILDEPISGLDPVQIVEVRQKVREMAGQHTVVLSSHILSEISQTCDRLLVIKDGRLVAQGTEQELVQDLMQSHSTLLELRGAGAQALELLGRVPGVTSARLTDQRRDSSVYEVSMERDVRDELARAVVEAGMGLLRLQPAAGGMLEDLFLKLAGSDRASAAVATQAGAAVDCEVQPPVEDDPEVQP